MPNEIKPVFTRAIQDAMKASYQDIAAGEATLRTEVIDGTYSWKVKAGAVYFDGYRKAIGDDKYKVGDLGKTEFAQINKVFGIDRTMSLVGIRAYATCQEDYVCYRASIKAGDKALDLARTSYRKMNKGGNKPIETNLRDLMPHLRSLYTGDAPMSGARNAKSPEDIRADEIMAGKLAALYNFGLANGAFEYDDWKASTSERNLIRGVLNRTEIDIARLRACPAADIDYAESIIAGVFAALRGIGPLEYPTDADMPEDMPEDIAPVKPKRARSRKATA